MASSAYTPGAMPAPALDDTIASPRRPTKAPLNIASLISPPEQPLFRCFSESGMHARPGGMSAIFATSPSLISPPISVAHDAGENIVEPTSPERLSDPLLFPPHDASPSSSQSNMRPLFAVPETEAEAQERAVIDQHIAAQPRSMFRKTHPPRRSDYQLTVQFQIKMQHLVDRDPHKWLKRERTLLRETAAMKKTKEQQRRQDLEQRLIRPAHLSLPQLIPARPQAGVLVHGYGQGISRVAGAIIAPKGQKPVRVTKPGSSMTRPARKRQRNSTEPEYKGQRHQGVSKHKEDRKGTEKKKEDTAFDELPDICPPRSSIPNRAGCMKQEWKGEAFNLSNDPHANLLHPEELLLASALRLNCATYLTSKRRIFLERLDCARRGKEFRKTDAQNICRIDVNKASRLWMAFDKIGWFERRWIQKYLEMPVEMHPRPEMPAKSSP